MDLVDRLSPGVVGMSTGLEFKRPNLVSRSIVYFWVTIVILLCVDDSRMRK